MDFDLSVEGVFASFGMQLSLCETSGKLAISNRKKILPRRVRQVKQNPPFAWDKMPFGTICYIAIARLSGKSSRCLLLYR
jgi:hypothetical protein